MFKLKKKIDREIKSFSDKQKFREFITTKPALQQMLNRLIQSRNTTEEKKIHKISPIQLRKWQQEHIYINNYFKCKWIKCSNQNTQTG